MKFILLTLFDGTPLVINTSTISHVTQADNPEHSEIVDMEGEAFVVQEEVKLVFEYLK